MSIEETLDKLDEHFISAILILKANEGYSVIPIGKYEYRNYFLMRDHFNGKTVLDAIKEWEKSHA